MRPLPILFLTLLLDTISIGILFPLIPSLFTDPQSVHFVLEGYSVRAQFLLAGAITAVFGLMQFLAAPVLGELSDIYGRKRLLTLGVTLLALANLLFGFGISIKSLGLLFVSRIIAGLAGANFSIAQATIADVSKPEERAKNFGLIGAAFGIGFILGPLLGGYISTLTGSLASPFWFAGVLGLANIISVSLFLPETRIVTERAKSSFTILRGIHNIKAALQDKEAKSVYIASFLYMSGFAFFTSFIGVLLTVRYSFSEANIATFFGVVGFCIVITQTLILPRVVKYYSERQILIRTFPVVACCLLLYPFMPNHAILYVIVVLMAIPQGLSFANISSLVSRSVSANKQGAALGINGSLMALAQGIIPLVAGVSSAFIGLVAPFIAGAVLIFTAWRIIWRTK